MTKTNDTKSSILGRGLSALIKDDLETSKEVEEKKEFVYIKIDEIEKNPYQPRTDIPIATIIELSDSIKEKGLILPVIVTEAHNPTKKIKYTLVAGERRLKACKMAGLKEVPALIREIDEQGLAEVALIENVHRKDLNPIEEAYGMYNLIGEFGMSLDQVAQKLSKTKGYVANKLTLTKLPNIIQNAIANVEISENHGRVLYKLQTEEAMVAALKIIVRNKLSVEKTTELVRQILRDNKIKKSKVSNADLWYDKYNYVMEDVSDLLGYGVRLKRKSKGHGGSLVIEFGNDEELIELHKKLINPS